jgi:hypothetical protein
MRRLWNGLNLDTTNRDLPMLERIARQKDAAYVYMQMGDVSSMVSKLITLAKMQDNYSAFCKNEVPSLIDFETHKIKTND